MVVVPIETPVTPPEDEPTVAIVVTGDIHRPPGGDGIQHTTVAPTQTDVGPQVNTGVGLSEMITLPLIVLVQPVVLLVATTV